ncbi:probable carboxylesterase 18 [Ricinus communis]|uniref:Gibberellin receptor GID1, putative n=1 Tax=Ricinus communis TaxID=3988 RepID=B9RWA6_RICCO|nr:probable carboxylesterase 18 [Ricinus communis]EEF44543.1 Gibberellin receptor GID1, putative [Ricinus communis]|eukprot:XP_002518025.1 probable carboxylesterase 18 [Ricinus communis]
MASKTEKEALPPPRAALPWRTRLVVSLISVISDAARRSDGTINRRLFSFFDFKAPPSPTKPIRSVISSDTMVDSDRNLWYRMYTPTDSTKEDNLPVMIFFHGGGFSFLSPANTSYDIVCRRFARRLPAIVVSVDYRLTPEHRFPSQYDDGFDVLKFLDDNHTTLLPPNARLSTCFLAGDSAGANIAHHVAVRACRHGTSFSVAKIVGLVSIQPFFGGEERTSSENRLTGSLLVSVPRTDWCWKVFLPEGSSRDHYAVNVSGPNAEDISGLDYPATLVFVGGLDPLQDWQRRYYDWLKRSGKEATLIDYPDMIHAFYIFPELPESSQLFSQVKDFVLHILSQQL